MLHICGKRYAQRSGENTEIRVYSNQPEVTLIVNGKRVGTQAADKVFVFRVALAPGMNTVIARAGSLWDSAVIERVEREPQVYTVPGEASG